jgi:hypothetical protein
MFAMFASPLVVATKNVFEQHRRRPANFCRFFLKERAAWRLDRYCCRSFTVAHKADMLNAPTNVRFRRAGLLLMG